MGNNHSVVVKPNIRAMNRWLAAIRPRIHPGGPWTGVMRIRSVILLALAADLCLEGNRAAQGQGVPEPSLVMYGIVSDAQGIRQTNGTLVVNIARPGGLAPLKLQTTLANINDQFSCVLFIACEAELPGFPVTAGDRLKLTSSAITYDRSSVTFNDAKILYTQPELGTLAITSKDRGRLDRVDLSPTGASELDSNGLLKSWQLQYFGRLGVDPNADPDGDGMSNIAEMRAGTDPTFAGSRLEFVSVDTAADGGAQIAWSSQSGRIYRVLRSRELLTGFTPVGTPQAATPPANRYVDNTATGDGAYFYRIQVVSP